jgi:hypothetical protein
MFFNQINRMRRWKICIEKGSMLRSVAQFSGAAKGRRRGRDTHLEGKSQQNTTPAARLLSAVNIT